MGWDSSTPCRCGHARHQHRPGTLVDGKHTAPCSWPECECANWKLGGKKLSMRTIARRLEQEAAKEERRQLKRERHEARRAELEKMMIHQKDVYQ